MEILVTGAAGFIGSAVAFNLRNNGHEVIGVDSFTPYYSADLKWLRKSELLDSQGIKFLEIDLSDRNQVDRLFAEYRFNTVIHLAAQPGVRIQKSNWYLYTRDNLEAFSNVLLVSVKYQVSNLLYASSSSVYGNAVSTVFKEESTETKPQSFYGATKLTNEILARACSGDSGLKTRGLRFFTAYGPWGRPDMVYFRMVNSALSGSPFDFFGTGDVRRDFTYIDDVSSSVTSLSMDLSQRDVNFSDVVNIGGGKPISINDCLRIVEEVTGSKVPFHRKDADLRDVQLTNADFTYLHELTGSFPKIAAREGFSNFVAWASRPDIQPRLAQWVGSVQ